MLPRRLSRKIVDAEPFQIWNAFINLLALEKHEVMDAIQRPPHLVFRYMSEVYNGGHLQYFENLGTVHLNETIDALGLLGANGQKDILNRAGELWLGKERNRIQTAEEFSAIALEGEFMSLDSIFNESKPTLEEFLEDYLRAHESSFVIIE